MSKEVTRRTYTRKTKVTELPAAPPVTKVVAKPTPVTKPPVKQVAPAKPVRKTPVRVKLPEPEPETESESESEQSLATESEQSLATEIDSESETESETDSEPEVDVRKELMKGYRKPMLYPVRVYIYTDIVSDDLERLLKDVQDIFLEKKVGTQFVVYTDPKQPAFDNSYCITNLFKCETKPQPFWRFTLGNNESKAVWIKEFPRMSAKELVKVIESSDLYSNELLQVLNLKYTETIRSRE